HHEVVDSDRRVLRVQLDGDVALSGVQRCGVALVGLDADRLQPDELVRPNLRGGFAPGELRRHHWLQSLVHREPCPEDGGQHRHQDRDRNPRPASPRLGEDQLLFRLDQRSGPGSGLGFRQRTAAAAMAAASPRVVYSRAMISTARPSLRAVSAVTGPMHAMAASPSRAGSLSSGNARTKFTTVDELVNEMTSTPSAANSFISAGPASGGQTAW